MLELIPHLQTFVRVAELGSFSAAGRSLNLANSTVSRHIAQLEASLGAAVFVRTTRSVRLTAVGQRLQARASALLEEVEDLARSVTTEAHALSGPLRVSVPWRYTRMVVAPLLAGFSRRYPNICVQLISDDALVNLVEEQFDVALRLGKMKDSNLVARKLGEQRYLLVASPGYLADREPITTHEDLASHRMVSFVYTTPHYSWTLRQAGRVHRFPIRDSVLQSNNADVLTRAAVDGVGLMVQPRWAIQEELERGQLVPVLTSYEVTSTTFDSGVYLVYPREHQKVPRVRAWVDYMREAFANGHLDESAQNRD